MNTLADKLQRSWQLFKGSVSVIRTHPKLLVFPIVTGLLTGAIALFFLAPVALVLLAPVWDVGGKLLAAAHGISFLRPGTRAFGFQIQPLGTAFFAGIYLLNMFLATMASVAFTHQILEALNGQPVSIRRGLVAACARWQSVFLWSLFAGVVGLVIRGLEKRFSLIGRLIAGLIGLAWSVASMFAISILARERTLANPFSVLVKSAETIKRTWGETLVGYAGMQGVNLMVVSASILFWVAVGALSLVLHNPWLLVAGGLPWLLAIIAYAYVANIASRVYLGALYLYAAEGLVPAQFDASMMNSGWKQKKQ